jgi:osmotically-inducible protein OsmY
MRIVTSLAAIATAILAAGCADEPTARSHHGYGYTETYPDGRVVATTTRYNQEAADRSLEASCREQLNRYGDLAATAPNVQIIARSGVVTLRGTVPSEREREMICACVKNNSGVVSLDDQLQVGYAPTGAYRQTTTVYEPPKATVYASAPVAVPSRSVVVVTEPSPGYERNVQVITVTDSDRYLAERIADSIRAEAAFPAADMSVTVRVAAGRADVRGVVEHGSEKHRLLEAVKRTPGVIEVKDHVNVR